jgi:hypothetical protein
VCVQQRPIGSVGVDGESTSDRWQQRGWCCGYGGSVSDEDATQENNVGLGEAATGPREMLGWLAGCGEGQASKLHGGDTMANGGKLESSRGCSGGAFYRCHDLDEGPR